MRKEVSPVVLVAVVVVVAVVIAVWGYRAMRPAPYQMSPGGGPRGVAATGGAPSPSSGGALSPTSAGAPQMPPPSYGGIQGQAVPRSSSGGYGAGQRTGSPTSAGGPPPGFRPGR